MMNTSLLQKSGLATLQVAQILAGLEPGDRIPTVTELSEQCEMARGNIQIALNNLKQNHVIRLESHGQNGTIATEIDYVAMAQYCSNTGLTCVMPMPYGLRYEGLASGLYEELNQKGVTGAIAFMRGSGYRLNCVEEGRFHLCVMSQLAFEHYAQEGKRPLARRAMWNSIGSLSARTSRATGRTARWAWMPPRWIRRC